MGMDSLPAENEEHIDQEVDTLLRHDLIRTGKTTEFALRVLLDEVWFLLIIGFIFIGILLSSRKRTGKATPRRQR